MNTPKSSKQLVDNKQIADKLFPVRREDIEVKNIPLEERRLHTETYDFSISTIFQYLKTDRIVIPQFQREYVWSRNQASRLIESLIIQCPIPVLYFNQTSDEIFEVIDGNQRVNAIKLYLEDGFPLSGLTAYPELEGFRFSELDARFQRHISNRTLRCITILKETHPQIKFDVFERLNTGAVLLSPQEIRHGIYYGKLIETIGILAENPLFRTLTGVRNDKRMKAENLILRFFAFYQEYENYKWPLVSFMNSFSERYRNPHDKDLKAYSAVFANTLQTIDILFGQNAFHTPGNSSFNTALYDAQMVAVARLNPSNSIVKKVDKEKLNDDVQTLMKLESFQKAVTASTSNEVPVKFRINSMIEVLTRYLKNN